MTRTLEDDLRDFDDERLAELFDARKDLAQSAPSSFAALASQAAASASVHHALGVLRRPELQLVDAFAAHARPLTPQELATAVSASTEHIAPHVYRLHTLALLHSDESGRHLVPVRGLMQARPHPVGLGPVLASDPSIHEAREIVSSLQGQLREIADQLAFGPARIEGSPSSPAGQALVAAGIARVVNTSNGQRLIIPRSVHVCLRDGVVHRQFARLRHIDQEPAPETSPGARDAQAREAALAAVRIVDSCMRWASDPPLVLKRGGIPMRDMRRLADRAGVEPLTWSTVIHAVWVASLIGHDGESWQLTRDFAEAREKSVAERWADLAVAWVRSNYVPSAAGTRLGESAGVADASAPIRAGLSSDVGRQGAKTRRRHLLRLMADMPDFSAPAASLADALAWAFPTVSPVVLREETEAFMREAPTFGLMMDGALTSLGACLARVDDTPVAHAVSRLAQELARQLPPVVDQIAVEPDLSLVVPGLPSSTVAGLLEWAHIHSQGATVTGHFSSRSVERAIDAGNDANAFMEAFETVSPAPIPEALESLVRQAARRRPHVLVQPATVVLTADDEHIDALCASPASASLALTRVAPTVVVSRHDPGFIMAQVRAAGLTPMMTGADGARVRMDAPGTLRAGPLPLELESDERDGLDVVTARDAVKRVRSGESGAVGDDAVVSVQRAGPPRA